MVESRLRGIHIHLESEIGTGTKQVGAPEPGVGGRRPWLRRLSKCFDVMGNGNLFVCPRRYLAGGTIVISSLSLGVLLSLELEPLALAKGGCVRYWHFAGKVLRADTYQVRQRKL